MQRIDNTTVRKSARSFSETRFGKHSILATDPKGLLPSLLAKQWQNTPLPMDYSPKMLGVSLLRDWEPPQSNEALDHTTPFENKVLGLNVDRGKSQGVSEPLNLVHRAKTYYGSGHVRINIMSALARYSRRVLESGSMLESRMIGPRSLSATKFLIPYHRLDRGRLPTECWARESGGRVALLAFGRTWMRFI